MGILSAPNPLDDICASSSPSCGSSMGSLGFGACFDFLGRSLASTPSTHNFSHLEFHSQTASVCFCTISFHSSSSAALAAFQSTCATRLCSSSSASFSLLSFRTSAILLSWVRCQPKPLAKSTVQSLFFFTPFSPNI